MHIFGITRQQNVNSGVTSNVQAAMQSLHQKKKCVLCSTHQVWDNMHLRTAASSGATSDCLYASYLRNSHHGGTRVNLRTGHEFLGVSSCVQVLTW